jgi:hypothetical protein
VASPKASVGPLEQEDPQRTASQLGGDLAAAEREFATAIRLLPGHPDPVFNLGLCGEELAALTGGGPVVP